LPEKVIERQYSRLHSMTGRHKYSIFLLLLIFSCDNKVESTTAATMDTSSKAVVVPSVVSEIPCPAGFERTSAPANSFTAWLREMTISQNDTVFYYDGAVKPDQSSHLKVLDFDVGKRDLQQCADAVIRLRAEYLWSANKKKEIAFHFTSGHLVRWSDYATGYRPQIKGSKVTFARNAHTDTTYKNFRKYLNLIFTYCGTYSLNKELESVEDESEINSGDVFIQTGNPYGHAVLVIDCVENAKGEKAYLLAQSYMPAQSIHILLDPEQNYKTAWYKVDKNDSRETPHWTFSKSHLKRFPK
jgi:hypothetical protein